MIKTKIENNSMELKYEGNVVQISTELTSLVQVVAGRLSEESNIDEEIIIKGIIAALNKFALNKNKN